MKPNETRRWKLADFALRHWPRVGRKSGVPFAEIRLVDGEWLARRAVSESTPAQKTKPK